MKVFEAGKIVLKAKIAGENWVFSISDVFYLSKEVYERNKAYNDTLGNYETEKALPTNSIATIKAMSQSGQSVTLQ